jgi:uncharacterized protein YlxW (UPF0749 family)
VTVGAQHRDTGTGWPGPAASERAPAAAPETSPQAGELPEPAGAGAQPADAPPEPAGAEPRDTAPVGHQDAAPLGHQDAAPVGRRASAAGAMIGLLLVVLGFALVTQVRNTNTDNQLSTARPEDLVRILSDLDAREERLRRELAELEESKRQLESGAQGREAALAEARRRAEVLGVLAGTLPAEGTEAMQISGATGEPVRIVVGSFFVDSGEGIAVDGTQMSGPYMIEVIGDPQTMQTALNIPGGVVDAVRQRGGNVTMHQPDFVRVTALHTGGPLRYARPVS